MCVVTAGPAGLLSLSLWFLLPGPSEGGATPLQPPYLHLPVFVESRLPLVQKEHFSPARGTGQEPLPLRVQEVLIPARPGGAPPPPGASGGSVRTWCELDKMRVQVERRVLAADVRPSDVTLGTCPASSSTGDHLHFEYDLTRCGTTRTMVDNQVTFTNTLRYLPPGRQHPIRWAAPFTLPVACHFNRYQYSYKIGFTPQMQLLKVFKQMKNGAKFILTPQNAQWQRLSPSHQFVLGKPMYFQAEAPFMSPNERLYIHSCHATPQRAPTSTPQFPVVKNFGCMMESRDGRSRFVPSRTDAVRFSVDAFLFQGATGQQLYMHCSMSAGSSAPTPTAKSCNYDTRTRRWTELHGHDAACDCCDSNCSAAASTVTPTISSVPWAVGPNVRSGATYRRKTNITTAGQPATERTEEERGVKEVGKVEERATKEPVWPYGGGGVTWEEVEKKQVKGSAVVEKEKKRKEGVKKRVKGSAVVEESAEPHRIFEDIFDFD